MAHPSFLIFEKIRPVSQPEVVDEFEIECIWSVVTFGIVNINPVRSTTALSICSQPERSAPGEIGNRRYSMPIVNAHRKERSIVISIAKCGLQADGSRLIAQHGSSELP